MAITNKELVNVISILRGFLNKEDWHIAEAGLCVALDIDDNRYDKVLRQLQEFNDPLAHLECTGYPNCDMLPELCEHQH